MCVTREWESALRHRVGETREWESALRHRVGVTREWESALRHRVGVTREWESALRHRVGVTRERESVLNQLSSFILLAVVKAQLSPTHNCRENQASIDRTSCTSNNSQRVNYHFNKCNSAYPSSPNIWLPKHNVKSAVTASTTVPWYHKQ